MGTPEETPRESRCCGGELVHGRGSEHVRGSSLALLNLNLRGITKAPSLASLNLMSAGDTFASVAELDIGGRKPLLPL